MRRLFFSLLAMSFISTVLGCCATHGVCDCSSDYDSPCAYREPWVNETVATPTTAPMPEIREALPGTPKKL
jgi:hypothetical protein